MKRTIAISFIIILVLNGILFAMQQISTITFFTIIFLAFLYVKLVQPKL